VKLVSECLGVARSKLTVRIKQSASPKVRRSRPVNDADLVVEIQQQVSELPSYGYRRVWGLLRRARETQSLPAINVKRVYRVMRDHNLLLERRIKQPGEVVDGWVMVLRDDLNRRHFKALTESLMGATLESSIGYLPHEPVARYRQKPSRTILPFALPLSSKAWARRRFSALIRP
jgi:transposase InsO family protein